MFAGGTRKLDLYDFFSVLLPGVSMLLGIAPFLPRNTTFEVGEALVILVAGGYIAGRAIHSLAVRVEDQWVTIPTHRELFVDELQAPALLSEDTVHQFCEECDTEFDAIQYDDESDLGELKEGSLQDLYILVRSYIHMDGRGRSRTFQAIYSFYRGMWFSTITVAVIYYAYALFKANGAVGEIATYTSFVGSLGIPPIVIWLMSIAGAVFAHRVFGVAREDFQEYFIQYLIADFLVLQGVDDPETVVTTTSLDD